MEVCRQTGQRLGTGRSKLTGAFDLSTGTALTTLGAQNGRASGYCGRSSVIGHQLAFEAV